MLRRVVAWTIGAAVVLGGTTVASAHPQIDRARARFDRADLDGALAALAAAESSDDLSRRDVVRLLELRAMVRFTQGEVSAMEQDLTRLASIDPEHAFGDEVPPDVVEAFARARGDGAAIELDVSVRRETAGVMLEARLRGDRGGLARSLVLEGRVPPGNWQEAAAPPDEVSLTLPATDADVQYYGRVLGPGGAVLFELGSRDEPRLAAGEPGAGGGGSLDVALVGEEEDEDDGEGGAAWWPYVAAGAGAVVVATVVVILLAGSGGGESELTRPGFPDVTGF